MISLNKLLSGRMSLVVMILAGAMAWGILAGIAMEARHQREGHDPDPRGTFITVVFAPITSAYQGTRWGLWYCSDRGAYEMKRRAQRRKDKLERQ